MRRSPDQQHIDDLARRRLDALVAELGGHPAATDRVRGEDHDRPADSIWDDEPAQGRHAHRPLSARGRLNGWLHDRLPEPLRGRVAVGPAQVGVVTLLLAVGVLWTAWATSRTAGDTVEDAQPVVAMPSGSMTAGSPAPLALPAGTPGSAGPDGGAATAPSGTAATAGAAAELVVDVQGTVRRPGIVVLPTGSRVVDAIEAAGGYTGRRGRLASVNLARPLVDGEQILVGRSGPDVPVPPAVATAPGAGTASQLVSLNTADQAALETLPGVGPVTAAAILQWREEYGPFTAIEQLLEVSGIGEKTMAEIAPFVTL